ncbi:hypothetical protein SGCZBJ_01530 [Caulobacter zeae]|uniref:histidine kinase n=1 Tax=Caulobacter zeae TaxID=2055137 RepID=A0A2N5DRI0_9CAUL|nr:DUF4118 domain-containing protein [Caulobacter zeae]PLR28658.1 hypothetical protein SGCZBJ_01530 [Caulobacter zeae]
MIYDAIVSRLHRLGAKPLGLWRFGAAAAIIAVSTGVAELLYRLLSTTRLSMVFLAGVLVCAVTLGSYPAYFAALLAFLIYNIYLVEPRFAFQMASPEDVLVLLVFLAVAVLTGGLAGRLKDEALRNMRRARATSALFEASKALSSTSDEDEIRQLIVKQMALAAKGSAMISHGARLWRYPEDGSPRDLPGALALSSQGWRVQVIAAEGEELGLAAWRSSAEDRPDEDGDRLINVLVDLGGAAIARARMAQTNADLAAASKTERLRTALLSSISHDLRTPLASILASASSLKAFGRQFSPEVSLDLIETIEEEAERLNRFVANLLSMTRLESGALQLNRQGFDMAEIVNRCATRLRRLGANIERVLPNSPCPLEGDPILLEQALDNVLDNAMRYAGQGRAIVVRLTDLGAAALLEVEDCGPGLEADEHGRIFDKFYRGRTAGASQGAGLGLSIARGLVEAMNGTIAAQPRSDNQQGLLVSMLFTRETALAA